MATAKYFSIIQALCRSMLASAPEITEHQIKRLIEAYKKDGNAEEAKSLEGILKSAKKKQDITVSRIRTSSVLIGEELVPNIPIPVDKETAAPLLEIFFSHQLPKVAPLFDKEIEDAVNSVIAEWINYGKLVELKATPSRSCLIFGSPGTGKTHLAKWIAKEVGLPVVLARLDGIVSSFLGTSSRNISNLFQFANRYRCVLLLDEFDAIAKLRNDPQEVGEVKRIVNTLLQNLDERNEIGFTIGVTNHEHLLDPAIWRRFDVQIEIPKPSMNVITILLQNFLDPLDYTDVELKFLSWCLQGSSGADIQKLSNWLKRMKIIDENKNESLIELMKRYTILNTGRISERVKSLIESSHEILCTALLDADEFEFKKKDIAQIFNMTPSSLSKQISKNK